MNNHTNYFNNIKRVAILSFQQSRKDLIEWSYSNKHALNKHLIISTSRTASLLEGTLNAPVVSLLHGRSGGYHQVKSLIEEKKVDILLMFGNNPGIEEQEPAFADLVNTAIRENIVVGYNPSTIDMLVDSLHTNRNTSQDDMRLLLRSQMAKKVMEQ